VGSSPSWQVEVELALVDILITNLAMVYMFVEEVVRVDILLA